MAFTYGFYNSLNGDRKYNAEDFSALFDGLITDGVFDSIGEAMSVIPGEGFGVIVKTGKAWFNHTWNINSTYQLLRLSTADPVRPRYDAVVLEVDAREESRKNSLKIIKGTPAVNPVYPTLTNEGDLHQYPLAYVRVNAGATSITESNIVPMVGQSPCPFVTGILKSVDITDLFVQWNGEFHDWFDAIQADLEGNVVTNLLHRIELVDAKANASLEFQKDCPNYYRWAVGPGKIGITDIGKTYNWGYDNNWTKTSEKITYESVYDEDEEEYKNVAANTRVFTIGDDLVKNADGTITVKNKATVTVKASDPTSANQLRGKWIIRDHSNIKTEAEILYISEFYFIPVNANVSSYFEDGMWKITCSAARVGKYEYLSNVEKYIITQTKEKPTVSAGKIAVFKGRLGDTLIKVVTPTKKTSSNLICFENIGFYPQAIAHGFKTGNSDSGGFWTATRENTEADVGYHSNPTYQFNEDGVAIANQVHGDEPMIIFG